ncbi:MAG: hypothetical protein N3A54_07240, partial [Patescibacteria group bacterium]|nr:hypothetical protein [Patescibacteria group bacterium]
MKNKIESESKESKNDDVLGYIPIDAIYDPSMRTIVDEEKPTPVAAIIRKGQTRYYSQENPVMQTEYSTSPEFYERTGWHLYTEYWKPVFERKKGDVRILVFGDGAGT